MDAVLRLVSATELSCEALVEGAAVSGSEPLRVVGAALVRHALDVLGMPIKRWDRPWPTAVVEAVGGGAPRSDLRALQRPEPGWAWPVEHAARALLQLALGGGAADRAALVAHARASLVGTSLPYRDEADADVDLAWAARAALASRRGAPCPPRKPEWRVWIDEGSEHGDLYELEQDTWHRVLDWRDKSVVASFREHYETSLGRSGGGWEPGHSTGVASVRIRGRQLVVTGHDGSVERQALPTS